MMFPKDKTLRCKGYLIWLRDQPCAHCGRQPYPPHSYSEPSHAGLRGMGLKAPDNLATSACRSCHTRHHAKEARHHAKYDSMNRVEYRTKMAELGQAQWRTYLEAHPTEKKKYVAFD